MPNKPHLRPSSPLLNTENQGTRIPRQTVTSWIAPVLIVSRWTIYASGLHSSELAENLFFLILYVQANSELSLKEQKCFDEDNTI